MKTAIARALASAKTRYWRLRREVRERARHAWLTQRRAVVELAGVKLRLTPYLDRRVLDAILEGSYEADELEMVQKRLAPDDVVMELGTGLGLLSTFCAKRIGSARVFTFEANPALEPIIRSTFELNGVSPTLEMRAVGPRAGTVTFHVTPDFWGASTVKYRRAQTISVPMTPFNEHAARIRPTFLIIDIEGGEYELVSQMDLGGVRSVAIELHPAIIGRERTQAVLGAFEAQGFTQDASLSGRERILLVRV
jgi:FkbM family methyltransferase